MNARREHLEHISVPDASVAQFVGWNGRPKAVASTLLVTPI